MNTTTEVSTCPTCNGQKTVAIRIGGESPKVQFPPCPECVLLPAVTEIHRTTFEQLEKLRALPVSQPRACTITRLERCLEFLELDKVELENIIADIKAAKAAKSSAQPAQT